MWQGRGKMMQQWIRSRMVSVVGYDPTKWSTGWDGESPLLHSIKTRKSAGRIDKSKIKVDVESGFSESTHRFWVPARTPIPAFPYGLHAGFPSGSTHWYCGACGQGPHSNIREPYCNSCQRQRTYNAYYVLIRSFSDSPPSPDGYQT